MNKNLTTIAQLTEKSLDKPQFVFRPESITQSVACFRDYFNATSLYAVKTNPDREVLQHLYQNGIRCFDVASLEEIDLVSGLFDDVTLYFMHPVKSRKAIREAYFKYGVRHFSLDHADELEKIKQETKNAKDLLLHVRIAIPNNFAGIPLGKKFGINPQQAADLIKLVDKTAQKTGICFHVGSQCMHPRAYRIGLQITAEVIKDSGVQISSVNVGGGFPSIYPGMIPPKMTDYFAAIHEEFSKIPGSEFMKLLAEPGRALVAESMSLIVQVLLRKDNYLYINDGTYGCLFDAGTPEFVFPMRLVCDQKIHAIDMMPFSFYGPTCDSLDQMKGPFHLPSDIAEGDYIEIGQMGSYSQAMATRFNGFGPAEEIIHIADAPLMSLYMPARFYKAS